MRKLLVLVLAVCIVPLMVGCRLLGDYGDDGNPVAPAVVPLTTEALVVPLAVDAAGVDATDTATLQPASIRAGIKPSTLILYYNNDKNKPLKLRGFRKVGTKYYFIFAALLKDLGFTSKSELSNVTGSFNVYEGSTENKALELKFSPTTFALSSFYLSSTSASGLAIDLLKFATAFLDAVEGKVNTTGLTIVGFTGTSTGISITVFTATVDATGTVTGFTGGTISVTIPTGTATGTATTTTTTTTTTTGTTTTTTTTTTTATALNLTKVVYVNGTTESELTASSGATLTAVDFVAPKFRLYFDGALTGAPASYSVTAKSAANNASVTFNNSTNGLATMTYVASGTSYYLELTVNGNSASNMVTTANTLHPLVTYSVTFNSATVVSSTNSALVASFPSSVYTFKTRAAAVTSWTAYAANGTTVVGTGTASAGTVASTAKSIAVTFDYPLTTPIDTATAKFTKTVITGSSTTRTAAAYSSYFGTPTYSTDKKTVTIPFLTTPTNDPKRLLPGTYSVTFNAGTIKDANGGSIDTATTFAFTAN